MECDPFSSSDGYVQVFDYTNLGSEGSRFQFNSNAGTSSNYIYVAKDSDERASAFMKTTHDVLDSWELAYKYRIENGNGFGRLGDAEGYTLVLTSGPSTSLGNKGDWGQGYNGMTGKSVAIAFDGYTGIGGSTRVGLFFNTQASSGVDMDKLCNTLPFNRIALQNNPSADVCLGGRIVYNPNLPGDVTDNTRDVKVVYDGVRHKIFLHIKYGSTWRQVMQGHVDMKQIFGSDVDKVRFGFTGSTGNWYWSQHRIYNLRFRTAKAKASESVVVENDRTVGAVHDDKSKPFKVTINARDTCGHDRAVGGENPTVSFQLVSDPTYVVTAPSSCNGANQAGTCDGETTNPTNDYQPTVGGTYVARFVADKPGYYDVKFTVSGATSTVGRVYVAE